MITIEYYGMKFTLMVIFLFPLALSATNIIYGQNATNQTGINSSKASIDLTTSLSIIVAVAAAVGIPTAAFTIYYQRKQQRLNAIKQAYEILNNKEHRKAREDVYDAFKKYKSGEKHIFESEPVKSSAAMVRADLDQIGLLITHKLIPKDFFLEVYWNTVLICWKALEDDVNYQRQKRDYPSYMYYFEQLKKWSENYKKENYPETEIKVY
jgi:hypothetical protein